MLFCDIVIYKYSDMFINYFYWFIKLKVMIYCLIEIDLYLLYSVLFLDIFIIFLINSYVNYFK